MEVKIIETGKLETLKIIDQKSGVDWINDLMGNHDALPEYDAEEGVYLIDQESFEWWKNLTEAYQVADDRYNDLLDETTKHEELRAAGDDFSGDLEDYPGHLNQVCDEYERSAT